MAVLAPKLYSQGKFDGIIALGGVGGTSIVASGMRTLPVGVPNVMVSTLASRDISGFIGVKDIVKEQTEKFLKIRQNLGKE